MADPADLRRRIVDLLAATEGMTMGQFRTKRTRMHGCNSGTHDLCATSIVAPDGAEIARLDDDDRNPYRDADGLVALANSRGLLKEVADYLGDAPGMEEVERLVLLLAGMRVLGGDGP